MRKRPFELVQRQEDEEVEPPRDSVVIKFSTSTSPPRKRQRVDEEQQDGEGKGRDIGPVTAPPVEVEEISEEMKQGLLAAALFGAAEREAEQKERLASSSASASPTPPPPGM